MLDAIGASILAAGPGIDSSFQKDLIAHYFFGNGEDYYLTHDEMQRYLSNPRGSEFDFGIGRDNPGSNGSMDRYDFDPQPWGNRTIGAEIATDIAAQVGATFGGQAFNVFAPPPYKYP